MVHLVAQGVPDATGEPIGLKLQRLAGHRDAQLLPEIGRALGEQA